MAARPRRAEADAQFCPYYWLVCGGSMGYGSDVRLEAFPDCLCHLCSDVPEQVSLGLSKESGGRLKLIAATPCLLLSFR
jgi:hypothetical protein